MSIFSKVLACVVILSAWLLGVPHANAGKPSDNEWYIKMVLVVEDGDELFYDDRSGVFGRLSGAKDELDKHDIPVFVPVDAATFPARTASPAAIAFSVAGAGDAQFLSNYQKPGSQRRTWDFTVYSRLSGGEATLYWQGPYELGDAKPRFNPKNTLLDDLWLVDLETGEVIKASVGTYEFNLAGKTQRNFRWVQKKPRNKDLELEPARFPNSSLQSSVADEAASPQPGNFGMPPAIGRVSSQAPEISEGPVLQQE